MPTTQQEPESEDGPSLDAVIDDLVAQLEEARAGVGPTTKLDAELRNNVYPGLTTGLSALRDWIGNMDEDLAGIEERLQALEVGKVQAAGDRILAFIDDAIALAKETAPPPERLTTFLTSAEQLRQLLRGPADV